MATERNEQANVEQLVGSSAPGAPEAAKVSLSADAELIQAAAHTQRLAVKDGEVWAADPDLPEDNDAQIDWQDEAKTASEDLDAAAAHLAGLSAKTIAGLAAKAEALMQMKGWNDCLPTTHEINLIRSLVSDAITIGRAASKLSVNFLPEYRMAQQPSHVFRTSEQKLLLLNEQYERVKAFDDLTYDMKDKADRGSPEEKKGEHANAHARRMRRGVVAEAYAIPATSLRAIALKARIMSGEKTVWWDPDADEQDGDARILFEDIFSLAGIDRVRGRDFDFVDILPEYLGPSRVVDDRELFSSQVAA